MSSSDLKDKWESLANVHDGWIEMLGWHENVNPHLPKGASVEAVSDKCECGVSITLGADDHPEYHSEWCPIKKKWRKENK